MKTSQKILFNKVNKVREIIDVGGLYHHYKDSEKLYVVETVGLMENNEDECVVYRALYGNGLVWVRTLEDFVSKITINGSKVTRFIKVRKLSEGYT